MNDHQRVGLAALRVGEWATARDAFAAAIGEAPSPEAHHGLGLALWCLGEVRAGLGHVKYAYAGYRHRRERALAARTAIWLARQHLIVFGSPAAARGWLRRAERLLADAGTCAERGLLHWFRAKIGAALNLTPEEQMLEAQRAHAIAVDCGDADLEVLALSELGYSRVLAGQVRQGFADLDEAMAAATGGEVSDLIAIADAYCNMVHACDAVGDVARGLQWCAVTEDFTRQHGLIPFRSTCRTAYANILIATGRWAQAEQELLDAAAAVGEAFPPLRVAPLSRLVVLRLRQGRTSEAAAAAADCEPYGVSEEARAAMLLAAGRTRAAAAICHRRIASAGSHYLTVVPFLELLTEADPGGEVAERLSHLAGLSGSQAMAGMAALANGIAGRKPQAELDNAISAFAAVGMPYHEGCAHLALARYLVSDGIDHDPDAAVTEASEAADLFARIGASVKLTEATELVNRLSRAVPEHCGLSPREYEVLQLIAEGLTNTQIAKRLYISPKTAGAHVTHILTKLGVRNRTEAATYALRRERSGLRSG
ncbi:MAG TPA: response regulator transcription factor [Micromonosporaceae bacterium]|nr:response regulator transcription factor [Micromonosporaceae bacterium]